MKKEEKQEYMLKKKVAFQKVLVEDLGLELNNFFLVQLVDSTLCVIM